MNPSSAEVRPLPWLDRSLAAAFLENVPEYVYFKDKESCFIAVSMSLVKYFGRSSVYEVLGKTDFDFLDEKLARASFEDEQRILRSGLRMLGKLEKATWPDGRITWTMVNKLPLFDTHGEIIGTFGIGQDVTASKEMEEALEKANKELVDASRLAGMTEVATGLLHNIGNVLNSLNVSATVLATGIRQSKADSLAKVCTLLDEHSNDLGDFLARDPKGKLVPEFLRSLSRHAASETLRLTEEIEAMQRNIDHIKEIVTMQQAAATTVGRLEPLDATVLMEDSFRINSSALARHDIKVVQEFEPVPAVLAERGKVLQILINLIRNAKYALDEGNPAEKVLTLRIESGANSIVRFIVKDNGVGIPAENLKRIFSHGFTTRADGHGFGLHSSVLASKDMKGSLTVQSEGRGAGATFILELPSVETPAESAA